MTLQDLAVTILAVTLVLFGFGIRYWEGKRRFNRRGVGGLQHYSSYSRSLIFSAIERFANFLSVPLILLGLFILVFWWMYVRDIDLSANKNREDVETVIPSDPRAHFLVPAEEGFG